MSDILGTIFGSKSKDKSSSTSSSTSHSGNYAFPFLQSTLAPTTQYLQKGGDMLGALLGINNPGNPGASTPTTTPTAPVNPNPVAAIPQSGPDWTSYLLNNPDVENDYNAHVSHRLFPTDTDYAQYHYQTYGQNEGRQLPMYGSAGPMPQNPAYAVTPDNPATTSTPTTTPQQDALNGFADSAGMQFLRDQGIKAIESSQAGKGLLQSGATGTALDKFGQGLAQTYLNQYMDQLLNYSRLGAQGAGILADVGSYSDGTSTGSSQGKGTGGKQGLVQTILGNPSAFSQGG